jgi:hypothetical protein
MDAFRAQFSDYRVKLGIGVALAQKLRKDADLTAAIRGKLTEQDLTQLLAAAADADRTVRTYATEALVGLADPRTTKIVFNKLIKTANENSLYNYLLSARPGWASLSETEKKDFLRTLDEIKSQASDRTKELIAQYK